MIGWSRRLIVVKIHTRETILPLLGIYLAATVFMAGCTANRPATSEIAIRSAIEHYTAAGSEQLRTTDETFANAAPPTPHVFSWAIDNAPAISETDFTFPYYTLGMMPQESADVPESQPTAVADVPDDYWRKDLWHQMGHEAKAFGTHDLWRGFKTSFWDLENALLLTAAMGTSVTIRETGVDGTIRGRIHGHRQLGDGGEVIQILGNPATHFAGTGIFWLTSALTKDAEQHEVSRALAQALAVTGITTAGLKFAAGTRKPDGDRHGWPSGHTSSTVAVAAVLNEYYGPWAGIPCFALAGLVGYERLDSREHDLSDVVFGAMLGYVVGTSIARDEKARFPELFGMTVVPFTDIETGASGLALMKSW